MTLRVTLWTVPVMMAAAGITFTLYENARHHGEPGWPWPTVLGVLVLGVVGPILSWLSLYWAIRTAEAYLASQAQLADRNAELATLNALGLAANSSLDMQKALSAALEQTMTTLDARAAMLFLQEDKQAGLRLEAHRGISLDMASQEQRLDPGHCLCGQAVKTRQVLLTYDARSDTRCTSNLCICEGFRSLACAPLEVKGQLVGLLQVASPDVGHFAEGQKDFLAAIARQISVSVENARLYDEVRSFNVELETKVNERTQQLESARWALAEKARQLQRLLSDSYRVQEDTQARIAHDMHDGVTQIIIGALYETQAARQALYEDPDRAAENLARAQGLLTEVETEIRRVIYDMHPPVLDQMGLVVALKRFASTYQAAFGIPCDIEVAGKPRRLSRATEVTVYRVIQAALHNVATHSHAGHVDVDFDFSSAALRVSVRDDGIGFDPDAVMKLPGEHLGLIGMKERAESLGAGLKVDSAPSRGTSITLSLPSPAYLEPS
ncbi:MAG TPA: GAF domain-containing sensor histidine kinase [Anaerolineales bacterium]